MFDLRFFSRRFDHNGNEAINNKLKKNNNIWNHPLKNVNYLGPLETNNNCYKHILGLIDAFSKFVWMYTCKSPSFEVILEVRQQSYIFGNFSTIISDKG